MISKDTENKLLAVLKDIEALESDFTEINSRNINIFEAAGLTTQEIKHSKALAFLLNPNESHGFGDLFFRKIITNDYISNEYHNSVSEFPPSALQMALSDFDDLVVRPEDMQIDLLMWSSKNKLVLAIENKVKASEGSGQLLRYKKRIYDDERFKGYKKVFIYLTADGDDASDNDWISISYKLIAEILENLITKSSVNNETMIFTRHYIDLIRKYVMNEENEDLKDACQALYEKHSKAFKLIMDNIDLEGTKNAAINIFKKEFKDSIKVNQSSSGWFSFLPNKLFDNMPDVELVRPYHNQLKPMVFFFNLDNERIKLTIEVGPIKDLDVRNRLVKALFKNIKNSEKEARSDASTRVWTKREKLDEDINDTGVEKIYGHMKTLYSQTNNLIAKIEVALIETFKENNQN